MRFVYLVALFLTLTCGCSQDPGKKIESMVDRYVAANADEKRKLAQQFLGSDLGFLALHMAIGHPELTDEGNLIAVEALLGPSFIQEQGAYFALHITKASTAMRLPSSVNSG
ncbi:MAG: hypothetical protein AAFX93_20665, partial [Verrucomicrobiota bacterium]